MVLIGRKSGANDFPKHLNLSPILLPCPFREGKNLFLYSFRFFTWACKLWRSDKTEVKDLGFQAWEIWGKVYIGLAKFFFNAQMNFLTNPIHGRFFSVHGILQARILEWIAIPFSRGSSWPSDRTQVSHIIGRFFTIWATREAWETLMEDKVFFFSNFFVKVSGDEVWSTSMEEGGGTPS